MEVHADSTEHIGINASHVNEMPRRFRDKLLGECDAFRARRRCALAVPVLLQRFELCPVYVRHGNPGSLGGAGTRLTISAARALSLSVGSTSTVFPFWSHLKYFSCRSLSAFSSFSCSGEGSAPRSMALDIESSAATSSSLSIVI